MWQLHYKENWARRIDAFELWGWRRLLRVPWTARRSNQSILKEVSPECSLEGLMLKLRLQYFGQLMQRTDSFEKTLMLGKIWRQEEKKVKEDEMVGWHHWLNGLEFEQAPGVGEGQGCLACCSPRGCKESDMTEQLNWTELISLLLQLSGLHAPSLEINSVIRRISLLPIYFGCTVWLGLCEPRT